MANVSNFPVMKKTCPSCPFGEGNWSEVTDMVKGRCITKASQICHHPRLHNKRESHLCRGARDFQITIFHRLGVLKEPTDKCWRENANRIK